MTPTQRKAMEQALEALCLHQAAHPVTYRQAITALRAALKEDAESSFAKAEQPAEQKPVAFLQFLTDVVTAAGLLSHGKTDKALAARISDFAVHLRTATQPKRVPLPPASPCALTEAEYRIFKLGWLECEAAHGIGEQE